jgi:hypothetical protein
MSFAITTRESARHLIPAVVSQDGTARLQTVEADEDSLLRDVLIAFYERTKVPFVLNTSFNRGGSPIVDSVDRAIETFASMAVNVLVLGRFVIIKNLSPQLSRMEILPWKYDIPVTVARGSERTSLDVDNVTSREVLRWVQSLTESVVFVRHDFPLYGKYLEWLREGEKSTTIRFRKGGVELPKKAVLPLFETSDFSVGQRDQAAAMVRIRWIRYQRFGELTAEDASKDGFRSLDEMLAAFKEIYPNLRPKDWVTIYGISLVSEEPRSTHSLDGQTHRPTRREGYQPA